MLCSCTGAFPEKEGGIQVLAGQAPLGSSLRTTLPVKPARIAQSNINDIFRDGSGLIFSGLKKLLNKSGLIRAQALLYK